ncbi:MAG: zinc ribbon domain-containing protein [Candidatus Altiarchaeota archaeon]
MRKPTKKQGFEYVLLVLVILFVASLDREVVKSPTGVGIGIIALAVGYFTGVMAFAVGILFSVYAFILSLPLISVVYAYLAYLLARIHYMIATFIFKKVLKRTKSYHKAKARIKSTSAYKLGQRIFNKVTKRMGLSEPHMLRVFEVESCGKCKRKIPKDGSFCPYCGVETA